MNLRQSTLATHKPRNLGPSHAYAGASAFTNRDSDMGNSATYLLHHIPLNFSALTKSQERPALPTTINAEYGWGQVSAFYYYYCFSALGHTALPKSFSFKAPKVKGRVSPKIWYLDLLDLCDIF